MGKIKASRKTIKIKINKIINKKMKIRKRRKFLRGEADKMIKVNSMNNL